MSDTVRDVLTQIGIDNGIEPSLIDEHIARLKSLCIVKAKQLDSFSKEDLIVELGLPLGIAKEILAKRTASKRKRLTRSNSSRRKVLRGASDSVAPILMYSNGDKYV